MVEVFLKYDAIEVSLLAWRVCQEAFKSKT